MKQYEIYWSFYLGGVKMKKIIEKYEKFQDNIDLYNSNDIDYMEITLGKYLKEKIIITIEKLEKEKYILNIDYLELIINGTDNLIENIDNLIDDLDVLEMLEKRYGTFKLMDYRKSAKDYDYLMSLTKEEILKIR